MDTFISYSSGIKRTAGKIKAYLDNYGFNCFLAHEDIPPQTVWPAEILKELGKCNLFLPLLTPGFTTSFFCQQETGFAYSRKVEILPVMISKAPMGMIADIQAVRFNKKQFEKSCWKIVEHVAKNTSLSEPILYALIKEFGESGTYNEACERAEKLLSNEFSFTRRQIRKIKKHIYNNSQINETKKARDAIFQFMKKHSSFFDDEFVEWYDRKSRTHMRY